jgi:hypothetical protein
MNPIDSTVESVEADGFVAGGADPGGRKVATHHRAGINAAGYNTLVKPFELWLKSQDATFDITFDRFCADPDRSVARAVPC